MDTSTCICTGVEQQRHNGSFFCARHQVWKTQHWHSLCREHPGYFQAWEAGHGPGQRTPPDPNVPVQAPRPSLLPGPGTELSKMLGCGGCKFAKEMNEAGPDGCAEHIDRFIRLLVQPKTKGGAQRMGRKAARRMITLAIARARQRAGEVGNA